MRAGLAIAAAAAALAGCALFDEPPPPDCPPFGRLKDADRLLRFDGQMGDPARLLFEAKITDVAAQCAYEGDLAEFAVGLRVEAEAGIAWTGAPMIVEVVIAHTSGEREVLRRETGRVELVPAPGAVTAFADFAVEYSLRANAAELSDDRIAMGLRLDREELRYLRALNAR